jgi:hypothetical protein
LGSFELRKKASRIQGKKIIPPSVQIIFNSERSLDDGRLAKNIASAEDISQEEAGQKVLEYIDDILFALNKGEAYVFEGFGKLYRDSENVFHFEKDPDYQVGIESFGLESFELDPIEDSLENENQAVTTNEVNQSVGKGAKQPAKNKGVSTSAPVEKEMPEKYQPEPTDSAEDGHLVTPAKDNRNNRNIVWILTGAVMVILVSFVLIRMTTDLLDGPGLSFFKSGQTDEKDLFPEDENWNLESSLNGELGEAIDSMSKQENALALKETSEPQNVTFTENTGYKEFHIIAGSFKDKEKAGILQQSLTEKGYPALVIQQGDQLYRVSAISFKDKEKGLQELSRFKQKTKNNAAWLLGLK